MLPKGKSRVAAILLKLKDTKDREKSESPDESENDSPSGDTQPGLGTAMEEFRSAFEDNDPEAMAEALASFLDIHKSCEDE